MTIEKTGKKAASAASKTLSNPKSSPVEKSAAGSALTQAKSAEVTGREAASAASKVLSNPKSSAAAKSAAASALSQSPSRKKGK
jgi:hypothetical protein